MKLDTAVEVTKSTKSNKFPASKILQELTYRIKLPTVTVKGRKGRQPMSITIHRRYGRN